jgi:NAD(P)-dependent dehydrogenase (short-subunit alcohol dehydrogenase family)
MEFDLTGKVGLITGGSAGIGKAIALNFTSEGAHVAIVGTREERLLDTKREIMKKNPKAEVLTIAADLSTWEGVNKAIESVLSSFRRIDILVNNAGSAPGDTIETMDEERFIEGGIKLKLLGYMRCIKLVLPQMKAQKWGRIINIIGNDGTEHPFWELGAAIINAACISMVHALSSQLGRYNILINAVNPGPVDTGRWQMLVENFARDWKIDKDRAHELALKSIPLRRLCRPDEVASLVSFLASDKSEFINGAIINIDGGQLKPVMISPFFLE